MVTIEVYLITNLFVEQKHQEASKRSENGSKADTPWNSNPVRHRSSYKRSNGIPIEVCVCVSERQRKRERTYKFMYAYTVPNIQY